MTARCRIPELTEAWLPVGRQRKCRQQSLRLENCLGARFAAAQLPAQTGSLLETVALPSAKASAPEAVFHLFASEWK